MDCPDCKEKLDRYVDRELSSTEVLELQLHLEGCPDCSDPYAFPADLKRLSEADGVHVGPDDITIEAARRIAGDRLFFGASASTPEAAVAAAAAGADYVGCGPAFATPVKSDKTVIGPAGVAMVAAAVSVPVFAIGGIDE